MSHIVEMINSFVPLLASYKKKNTNSIGNETS